MESKWIFRVTEKYWISEDWTDILQQQVKGYLTCWNSVCAKTIWIWKILSAIIAELKEEHPQEGENALEFITAGFGRRQKSDGYNKGR